MSMFTSMSSTMMTINSYNSYVFPHIFLTDFTTTPVSYGSPRAAQTSVPSITNASGSYISPDGTQYFVANEPNDTVLQYSMSTAFDPSTLAAVSSNDMTAVSRLYGMTMNPDLSKIWTADITSNVLEEFELTVPGDITSVNETPLASIPSTELMATGSNINGMFWNIDGTQMYIVHNAGVSSFPVSTPYDISTDGTPVLQLVTGSGTADIQISQDGFMIWLCWGTDPTKVRHIPLTQAYKLKTAVAAIDADLDFTTDAGNAAAITFFYVEERGEIWILDNGSDAVFVYIAPTVDPFFENVVLLLPFDGIDAATSTTDESDSAHSITFNGTSQIDTAESIWGGSSLLLDGNSDYLEITDSADFFLGSQDFTVEAWLRFNALGAGQFMCSSYENTGNDRAWAWVMDADERVRFGWSSDGSDTLNKYVSDMPAITTGVWYHAAAVKSSGVIIQFWDGVQLTESAGESDAETDIFDSSEPFRVGTIYSNGLVAFFNGHIDDFRLTVGLARYTSDFTPPTAPFPKQ